jgi:hypothetical protein
MSSQGFEALDIAFQKQWPYDSVLFYFITENSKKIMKGERRGP